MKTSFVTRFGAAAAVAVASLVAIPAAPATAGLNNSGVVINEVYLNGTQSTSAAFKSRYFELYNPTDAAVNVNDWSLQYKSATGTAFSSRILLTGKTIAAGGYLLVSGTPAAGDNGAALPTPDVTGSLAPSGSNGVVALSKTTAYLTATGALSDTNLVDLVGYGNATLYEGSAGVTTGGSPSTSITRSSAHTDTNVNSADFTIADPPTPCNSAGCPVVVPPVDPDPVPATIEQIQGTGATSPLDKAVVTTTGVVTAVYPTGGLSGGFIQTAGTGATAGDTSHGLFVFSSAFGSSVAVGDHVEVTGAVSEFGGTTAVPSTLTEITTSAGKFRKLDTPAVVPVPTSVTFPLSETQKEALEGMVVKPQGGFTITNNFSTNQYGEIGLAPGARPFDTPTNVVSPGAAAAALQAKNDADLITLDDGAGLNFLSSANQGTPLPWLTATNEIRAGQAVSFADPVVLDFRNSLWKLQPLAQVTAGGDEPVDFGPSTRAPKPLDVGGEVKLATFNVLNYFPTTGADYVAANTGNKCSYYIDRAAAPVTTNQCGNPSMSTGNGPRGAANQENLARQQAKIVTAINTLDADVVSLEEIENSATFGKPRDFALNTLVAALNTQAGSAVWAAVPSPATVPTTGEDVIRTAFIYKPAKIKTVGTSTILNDPAFVNARAPLAQTFAQVGKPSQATFAVIVNHFKSKGSGSGADADQGDGQGASNLARTKQATALVSFVDTVEAAAGTDKVFLTGDFNSYNKEDPVRIIEQAGFVNLAEERTDKETYQFDGAIGSLDHVFASTAADDSVTGTDIWNINSYESVAREYSRFNYNATDFYRADPYRASDHDPEIVGFTLDVPLDATTTTASVPATVRAGDDLAVTASVSGDGTAPSGEVVVTEGDIEVGRGSLSGGAATIAIDDLSIGSHALTVSYGGDATHAGSTDTVSTEVLKSSTQFTAAARPGTYGTSTTVDVTGAPGASGLVYVSAGGQLVGMGLLTNGVAAVPLSSTLPVGTTPLTVFYAGNGSYDPASATTSVTVGKAASVIRERSVSPTKIVEDRTKPFVTFAVTGAGFTVDGGTVTVRASGKEYTGTVRDGSVRIRLGKFTSSGPAKKVTATYSGNGVANGSTTTFTVKVRKK